MCDFAGMIVCTAFVRLNRRHLSLARTCDRKFLLFRPRFLRSQNSLAFIDLSCGSFPQKPSSEKNFPICFLF
jgi:hypothetical protein